VALQRICDHGPYVLCLLSARSLPLAPPGHDFDIAPFEELRPRLLRHLTVPASGLPTVHIIPLLLDTDRP
jgi:hypothetical protein